MSSPHHARIDSLANTREDERFLSLIRSPLFPFNLLRQISLTLAIGAIVSSLLLLRSRHVCVTVFSRLDALINSLSHRRRVGTESNILLRMFVLPVVSTILAAEALCCKDSRRTDFAAGTHRVYLSPDLGSLEAANCFVRRNHRVNYSGEESCVEIPSTD